MTASAPVRPSLVVSDLSAGYGPITVVRDFSLEVGAHEIVALLGRNGAGKSTALSAIAGLRRGACSGSVFVGDQQCAGARPSEIYDAGLAFVPEGHRVFGSLAVDENLRLGAYPARRRRPREIAASVERVYELFPVLADFRTRPAGFLSGGQQQMVAIGQALVADPSVLMLDEPSSGLAPAVVDDIYRALRVLRDEGRAVLVVEQNIDRALTTATRAYVLDRGSLVLSGTTEELAGDGRIAAIVRGATVVD